MPTAYVTCQQATTGEDVVHAVQRYADDTWPLLSRIEEGVEPPGPDDGRDARRTVAVRIAEAPPGGMYERRDAPGDEELYAEFTVSPGRRYRAGEDIPVAYGSTQWEVSQRTTGEDEGFSNPRIDTFLEDVLDGIDVPLTRQDGTA